MVSSVTRLYCYRFFLSLYMNQVQEMLVCLTPFISTQNHTIAWQNIAFWCLDRFHCIFNSLPLTSSTLGKQHSSNICITALSCAMMRAFLRSRLSCSFWLALSKIGFTRVWLCRCTFDACMYADSIHRTISSIGGHL